MFSLSILTLSLSPLLLFSAVSATEVPVLGPVSRIHVGNKYLAPDGFNRSTTLVNGVFPAPVIKAYKNDPFAVRIINQLKDDTMPLNTSVHWHGISQRGTNWADGTDSITQCAIRPDKSFTARFTATDQTGTYWYHSHSSTQYCDGLRGPLIIYDPEDPLADLYDVDDENTIITLSDWYHKPSGYLSTFQGPVTPNSTLINGRGRYPGGPSIPWSVTKVQPGLRYRFRLINMACHPAYNFTIDGHRMTVIEVDGVEVEPTEVDSIFALAGQRYSVVVTANQPVGNYWIRASTTLIPKYENDENFAILRYEGAQDEDPTTTATYELPYDEGSIHPLINPGAPGVPGLGNADVNIQLPPGLTSDLRFTFGNASFVPPPTPVLLQILNGDLDPSQILPNGTVVLPPNKVIELSFPNYNNVPGAPHPVHMHGHNFDIVRVAGSNTTNYVNPIRRDTFNLGVSPTDNVTIRFVTNNAGPWFLHCHIDWHLNIGFGVVLAEAPQEAEVQQKAAAPEEWRKLCDEYDY